MKKYYLFSLMFLCLFLVVISCEERVEDGVHISYYENGQKMYENTYDDGKLISEKKWNEDGSVKE